MSPSNTRNSGRVDSTMILLVLLLLMGMGGFGYNFYFMNQVAADWDNTYSSAANSLRVTSEKINGSAREAFSGSEEQFAELEILSAVPAPVEHSQER